MMSVHFQSISSLELSGGLMSALHILQKALSEPNAFSHLDAVCLSVFICYKIYFWSHTFAYKHYTVGLGKMLSLTIITLI